MDSFSERGDGWETSKVKNKADGLSFPGTQSEAISERPRHFSIQIRLDKDKQVGRKRLKLKVIGVKVETATFNHYIK